MEIRAFAEQIVFGDTLEIKLRGADGDFTDNNPGNATRPIEPTRPANLQFAARRKAPTLPSPVALQDPLKRGVAHHIMANHELQAVEVMAWTLLAFPDAPTEFRIGLTGIIADEQRHTRMHSERSARLGVPFGSLPVNCYIWKKAMSFCSVLDYVAGLPLVFEGANLDHSLELAEVFQQLGDERSAALMRVIHRDEIGHVRFGIEWLRKLKPESMSDWDAFVQHLHWPLRPIKARGDVFQKEARLAAGLSEEFIQQIESAIDEEKLKDQTRVQNQAGSLVTE